MSEIAAFIEARLDEDEATARGAIWQRWSWDGHLPHVDTAEPVPHPLLGDKPARVANCYLTTGKAETEARHAAHIARQDPARVLREIAAKRKHLEMWRDNRTNLKAALDRLNAAAEDRAILRASHDYERLLGAQETIEAVLRINASVHADHPDFRPAWRLV